MNIHVQVKAILFFNLAHKINQHSWANEMIPFYGWSNGQVIFAQLHSELSADFGPLYEHRHIHSLTVFLLQPIPVLVLTKKSI